MVNGPAMILAIANNIFHFVGAEAMRNVQMTFGGRPSVELVGNRPAGAHGICPQLTHLKGNSDFG